MARRLPLRRRKIDLTGSWRAIACAFVLLSSWSVAGCAKGQGRSRVPEASGGRGIHTIRGRVFFEANYELPDEMRIPQDSWIPSGLSPVSGVRVCLFEQKYGHDLAHGAVVRDDQQLGCRTANADGTFEFRVQKRDCPKVGDCARRFYYATDLCIWGHGKPQACVTANTRQEDPVRASGWAEYREYRKLVWSNTYKLDLDDRTSNFIAFNLSCPAEDQYGRTAPTCARENRGGYFDRKHSNYGYNKEFVHALGAAAQVVRVWGDLTPGSKNTNARGGRYCGNPKDEHNNAFECQDAVRVVLMKSRKPGMKFGRHCGRSKWGNFFFPWRSACIGEPLQPYATPHEMGHVVHARFMNYRGAMNSDDVSWRTGTSQKSQVGEGWADFFATATWYGPDAARPRVSGYDMEERRALSSACRSGVAYGELHAAQFFWDLYDAAKSSEPQDAVAVELGMFLRVWSTFAGKRDGFEKRDRAPGECNPHGRNVHDFVHYWRRLGGVGLPDPGDLMQLNCVDRHETTTSCR